MHRFYAQIFFCPPSHLNYQNQYVYEFRQAKHLMPVMAVYIESKLIQAVVISYLHISPGMSFVRCF